MSDSPLVSVIIPYCDSHQYFAETLSSVTAQTYRNLEIIVVDDYSSRFPPDPECAEIAELTLVRHPRHRGVAAARNTGVSNSRGSLILPLDSDDCIEPDYLAALVSATVSDTTIGGAFTPMQLFGDENLLVVPEPTVGYLLTRRPAINTFLYRREVFDSVGGYREDLSFDEERQFWLNALGRGWSFARLNEPYFLKRVHRRSRSGQKRLHRTRALLDHNRALFEENIVDILSARHEEYTDLVHSFGALSGSLRAARNDLRNLAEEYERLISTAS